MTRLAARRGASRRNSCGAQIDQSVKYMGPLVIHPSGTKDHPLGDGAGGARAAT